MGVTLTKYNHGHKINSKQWAIEIQLTAGKTLGRDEHRRR